MLHKCLIIGSDHHNTLGVVESLGQKGIKPYVIITSEKTKSFVLQSKYVAKGWICAKEDDVLKCLINNFNDRVSKTVVIVTNDKTAALIDTHYDELKEMLLLPGIENQGMVNHWMNKETMDEAAAKIGINVPQTWVFKKGDVIPDVTFPCITKSIATIYGAKTNIRICRKREDLESFLSSQKKYPLVQIQAFVDKEYEFQFIGCSLNGGEEIIIPGRTHIKRSGIENTFFLRFAAVEEKHQKTLDLAKQFIKETRYSGLFSIEFLHGKDGRDYFLEMNFRNDGNAVCSTAYGVNLPYIWYLYNIGGDYKSELKLCNNPTYFFPEEACLIALSRKEISFGQWCEYKRKATCYALKFNGDRKPYRTFFKMKVGKMIRESLRKLTRQAYFPAFITTKPGSLLTEGNWNYVIVKHKYKDRWFADPFILDVTDTDIILLVEEVRYDFPTGRITKMTVDRNSFELKSLKVILELETHLSFPAVYRGGEDVWIYPESAASGKLTMYKYNTSDDTLEPYSTIIDKEVSDAVLYQGFGKPCMIATSRPNSNGKYVEIYESDDVFSNYNLCDKIEFNDKIGRSAGDIMSYNGDLIRPAQICNNSYGEGLCFQKFNKIDGKYTLQEISRVNPPRGYNGLHTINCYKGYKVVDLRRVMYPFFFKLNAIIRKIF